MESGPNIQLLQSVNSYRNIKKRKLIWPDVKSGRPMCLIMSWENHNQPNIFGSLNCFYLECIKMNNDEAIVVEHNTTDRIESLYDDIRSVEKRLGTVFSISLSSSQDLWVLG